MTTNQQKELTTIAAALTALYERLYDVNNTLQEDEDYDPTDLDAALESIEEGTAAIERAAS